MKMDDEEILSNLSDIRMTIPPELLERIAHANMVATMAASIDFTDKVQREHFEKAKKSADAAIGAIEDNLQCERFLKQLYLEMKSLGLIPPGKEDKEILSNNLCILPDIRMKPEPVSPTDNYILPDIKMTTEKKKRDSKKTDFIIKFTAAITANTLNEWCTLCQEKSTYRSSLYCNFKWCILCQEKSTRCHASQKTIIS